MKTRVAVEIDRGANWKNDKTKCGKCRWNNYGGYCSLFEEHTATDHGYLLRCPACRRAEEE